MSQASWWVNCVCFVDQTGNTFFLTQVYLGVCVRTQHFTLNQTLPSSYTLSAKKNNFCCESGIKMRRNDDTKKQRQPTAA